MNIVNPASEPIQQRSLGERWYADKRNAGLSRFAVAITSLNILGHLYLGFEQSWITPFVALLAAYSTEFLAETAAAASEGRKARYRGTPGQTIAFFLSAHISGLAVGMLLFAAEQLWIIAFAASMAIASKWLFRISIKAAGGVSFNRHFLNPSNFGITIALLLFPSVGIAPPYMFSENITGIWDWLLPSLVITTGSLLNTKLTGRMPLIGAWVVAFATQAIIRSIVNATPVAAALLPMTGFAFILFTFYMITDPGTTPGKPSAQACFAVAVALAYAALMELHIVFGLFYALTIVTALRGVTLFAKERKTRVRQTKAVQSQAVRISSARNQV
ncbi:enediyne biosynthesis protein UnbU [Rhizobium sp. 2YAF20]|uniref:hypothetical protein n=1 Tax=Rhizobium sp. 2YAF20 TaxID=3233027 RepID=UPI003F9528C7